MIAFLEHEHASESVDPAIRRAVDDARMAARDWALQPVRARAKIIGRMGAMIADHALELAEVAAAINDRPVAEKLVSEVLPLAEACRFLARKAPAILRPKRFGAHGRPLWLKGSSFEVQRKPFGAILIVGPGNYPLFLPVVQALHALAAGNAVLLKPAENTSRVLETFCERVLAKFLPAALVQILPESITSAHDAVAVGIDKAIFTGNSENGRDFLHALADRNVPSVMELSGEDVLIVRADADLEMVSRALEFGLRLNGGDTCMAPRTIIAHAAVAGELRRKLATHNLDALRVTAADSDEEIFRLAAQSAFALGASIFSRDEKTARALAAQLLTGFVTINDLIVPTADPRFPFSGARASGFGTTRGAEGLLEMTFPQVVSVRRGKVRQHFAPHLPDDENLFAAYIALAHGRGWRGRAVAAREFCRAGMARMKKEHR